MFTGIVEELGSVKAIYKNAGGARIEISAREVLTDSTIGGSISVNGCCLTVVEMTADWWAADAVEETLRRTSLGTLKTGDPVNLERPVRLADRLGGHLVQGHIDGVGSIASKIVQADGSVAFRATAAPGILRYVVEKGSIAVDGVSLTVTAIDEESFSIALIPHTLAVTTLGVKVVGDPVNLEVDLIAKYVERLMAPHTVLAEPTAARRQTR